jgi:hypothetical protein
MSAMIHIDGPKDGDFIARFVTADGRSLAILVPEKNAAVLRDLQEHMPYGLAVRDIDDADCQAGEGEALGPYCAGLR